MTTFKQFLESQTSGGVPTLKHRQYQAAVGTPPNQYTTPDYVREMARWELECLERLYEFIEISNERAATGRQTPIVVSQDGKHWMPVVIMHDGHVTNDTSWHPKVFEMLVQKRIISPTPNAQPLIDVRNNKRWEANTLCEVYTNVLTSELQKKTSEYKFIGGVTDLGGQAFAHATQGRLPAFHGTTIMTGH